MEIEQQYTSPQPGPNIQGNLNFGPYVAYFKIPQSFREGLLKKGNLAEPKTANKRLVGLIGDQRNYSIEDKEWFVKQFQPYIETYVQSKCRYCMCPVVWSMLYRSGPKPSPAWVSPIGKS